MVVHRVHSAQNPSPQGVLEGRLVKNVTAIKKPAGRAEKRRKRVEKKDVAEKPVTEKFARFNVILVLIRLRSRLPFLFFFWPY